MKKLLIGALIFSVLPAMAGVRWDFDHLNGNSRVATRTESKWKLRVIKRAPDETTMYVAYNEPFIEHYPDSPLFGLFCYSSSPNVRVFLSMGSEANRLKPDDLWDINIIVGGDHVQFSNSDRFASRGEIFGKDAVYADVVKDDYLFYKLKTGQDVWVSLVSGRLQPFFHQDQIVETRIPLDGANAALQQLNRYCRITN